VLLLVSASAWALGPPPEATPTAAQLTSSEDAELTVLDVNEGAVAVKLVGRAEWYRACDYAGMNGEKVDVKLALFDLEAHHATVWRIYEGTQSPGTCTPHATSERRLAEAKAAFVAAGLDLSALPPPDAVGTSLTVQHGEVPVTLEARSRQRPGGVVDGRFDEELAGVSMEYEVWMDGVAVHRDYAYTLGAMGHRVMGRGMAAWVRGDHVVLRLDRGHTSVSPDDADEPPWRGTWTFTRVKLPDGPPPAPPESLDGQR